MEALILAAGYGTRMHPLTRDRPKALLEVGGRTVLGMLLENLRSAGVGGIWLVTNRRFFPAFEKWVKENGAVLKLLDDGSTSNEERLGAVADIAFAVREGRIRDDLLVICSDRILDFPLSGLAGFFREKRAPVNACCEVGRERIRGRHGCVILGEDGRIEGFEEKPLEPKSRIASLAVYVFPKEMLGSFGEYMEGGGDKDSLGGFVGWISRKVEVYGFITEGECHDIGSMEDYRKLCGR